MLFFPEWLKGLGEMHYHGRGHIVVESQSSILQIIYYSVWAPQLFSCFVLMPPK